jgi:hypothetical protein
MKTSFTNLEIGAKFFTHKFIARDGSLQFEVLKKTTKSKAVVVEAHGNYHTIGHIRAVSSMFVFAL